MEKKRSIGVAILGILTILGGLVCLPLLFDSKPFVDFYVKPFGMILFVLSIPLSIMEIVLGWNILKLKEWSRKYLVILSVAYAVSIFLLPYVENKNYENIAVQELKKEFRKGTDRRLQGYVTRRLISTLGDPVGVRVDYEPQDKKIVNVAFYLINPPSDGQYDYEFNSKEGEKIIIHFFYESGALSNVRLDTVYRPSTEKRQMDTILTLLSDDQRDVAFTFSWNFDGSIKNVNVKAEIDDLNIEMDNNFKNFSPVQQERIRAYEEDGPVMVMKFILIFLKGIFLLFYLVTIFFFTRPKVKEQFS